MPLSSDVMGHRLGGQARSCGGSRSRLSYRRRKKSPGGGCAIVYDKNRFRSEDPDIVVPENIEAVWSVLTPKIANNRLKVKRIAVGSIYVSPRSQVKPETIEHILESIHLLRAQYDNDIHFLVGGDCNWWDITDIL